MNSIESDTKIESVPPFEELPAVVCDVEAAGVEIVGIQEKTLMLVPDLWNVFILFYGS